ncbi:hypothetical protein [Methylobacterium trifolii]|nr:hypothetical protein [Methylobacterium trifolii]
MIIVIAPAARFGLNAERVGLVEVEPELHFKKRWKADQGNCPPTC